MSLDASSAGTPAASEGAFNPPLSPAHLAILRALARGLREKEIARLRSTSPATVHAQVHQVKVRLGAKTAAHAVAIAMTMGWIRL